MRFMLKATTSKLEVHDFGVISPLIRAMIRGFFGSLIALIKCLPFFAKMNSCAQLRSWKIKQDVLLI